MTYGPSRVYRTTPVLITTKDHYARFYHYNLTTEEVKGILYPVRPRE
jgi:hypothetical protein